MAPRLLPLALSMLLACGHAQAQAAYEDRIIDPDRLPPLPPDEDDAALATETGWPRGLSVEAFFSESTFGDRSEQEAGLGVSGFVSTPDWGDFSLSGTLSQAEHRSGTRNSLSAWQRNLRFDNGLVLDTGLGVSNTPAPDLMRQQYRFFLPTVAMRGVQTQLSGPNQATYQAAFGQPGIFSGARVAGFESRPGHVAQLGASRRIGERGSMALSALDARIEPEPDDRIPPGFLNPRSTALFGATAWEGERDRIQFNALASRTPAGSAAGAWFDASSTRGRYAHHYGAFYLQPELAWGLAPINNDLAGGYYRLGYQYGRLDWGLGADVVRSLSGQGLDGVFATGHLRYQTSNNLGYGGSASLRTGTGRAASALSGFVDRRFRLGQSRLQLDLADDGGGLRDQQLSLDHAFDLKGSNRLAVNLAVAQTQGSGSPTTRQVALLVYGSRDLSSTLAVDGNVRLVRGGDSGFRGSDVNLGLHYRPNQRWSVSANYYRSQGTQRTPFVLDPLVPDPGRFDLPQSSGLNVSVRYAWSGGSAPFVLGGAPGSASGSLSGSLFLDENENGRRDANELPAANVTVLLDGRFSVRTDSQGRYVFERVSAGAHRVTLVPDNLPLPWSFAKREHDVRVGTRASQVLDVGATRPR